MTWLLFLLLAYSVALIGVGAWIGRAVRRSEDFFVGGRSLGAAALFATFLAANIGAGSTVNATGLAYHHGLAAWWWNGAAGIGTLILAFWIGPRIWRLAAARGYLTVGDFLEDHFGRDVRLLSSAIIWIGSLHIFAGQVIGASAVLQRVGNVSPAVGAVIAVIAMTAYFTAGGLLSSAWVNRLQLLVIATGFAFAAPMALGRAGVTAPVLDAVPGTSFLAGSTPDIGWSLIFLMAPAFFLSPGLVQRAFAAKDERALTRGVGWSGVALMVFAWAPVMLGMSARVLFPELESLPRDQVLPTVLTQAVPAIIGAVALAAVFSAEISSADAVLYMLSTSGARDFYRSLVNPEATDAQVLRMARVIALAAAGLGLWLVFEYDSVYRALAVFYSVLSVTLLAPILGGLFLPRGGRIAALASMGVGLVVLFVSPYVLAGRATWISPTFLGLVSSTVAYLAVTGLRSRP